MKVLIISHNPISTYQNMGKTLLSLFGEFKKEELCQLYIYPTHPDIDFCASYFRITDKEILKSHVNFKSPGGIIPSNSIHSNRPMYDCKNDETLYRNPKNKSGLRRIMRDLMWKISRWYSIELQDWIRNQEPTCIFVAPGIGKFLYDIALKISRKFEIPIVTYICDEYYFLPKSRVFFERIQRKMFRAKFRELLSKTNHCITISEELRELYQTNFNIPCTVIMTGSLCKLVKGVAEKYTINKLSYFGNVRCNRYLSLCEIGKVLDKINEEKATNYKLEIYSIEKNSDILNHFKKYNSIEFKGFLTGDEYSQAVNSSDMLVHVEGFDKESIEKVKYSVSTKIADSLASGTPLFVYAPRGLSSVEHLRRNECALISENEKELKELLENVFSDGDRCIKYVDRALSVSKEFHDALKNSKKLYEVIKGVENEIG